MVKRDAFFPHVPSYLKWVSPVNSFGADSSIPGSLRSSCPIALAQPVQTGSILLMSFESPTCFEKIGMRVEWTLSGPLIAPYLRGLKLRGDEVLLEVGCGGGAVTKQLSRLLPRGRVVGVDPSAYWVEYARRRLRRLRNVALHAGDVLTADIDPETFDAVLFHYVLHDIAASDRPTTLGHVYELLKEDGRLFLREPTKESHGVSLPEIRPLTGSAGFREERFRERKAMLFGSSFEGTFRKA